MQKNQVSDSQELFERYCSTKTTFGFSSATNDINLMKLFSLPIPENGRSTAQIFIRKTIQLISLKFGVTKFLDALNTLCGAYNLDSILIAHKALETTGFFVNEGFCQSDKLHNKKVLLLKPLTAIY